MAGPPNNVAARALAPKWVEVTWDPIVNDGGWDIAVWREPEYQAPYPRGWLTDTSFTDQAAQPDTEYTYRVCVIYEGDPESHCASTKVKTPPATASTSSRPTPSLTDLVASPRSITIRWDGHHDYSTYEIAWGRGGDPGGIQEVGGGTTGEHTFVPLDPDTEYHFAVRGVVSSFWGLDERHSGWSTVQVKRTAPPLNLPWHPWFPITDKPEDPNHAKFSTATPPVALARDAQHQDLFVIGTDGRVWTTYWSLGDRGWHPWFPITDKPEDPNHAKFSTATPPAALARDAQHQDLFVIGTDGRVWTTYWSLGDRGWHPWFPITDKPEDPNHAKFSTATPPVALARDAQHQDLFVIGTDGRVWTTYWSLGDRGWHPWFPITDKPEDPNHAKFSTATPPVALARDAQHQDLFVIGTDGRVWTTYWSLGDRGWHPWFPITDKPEDPNHAKFSTATPPAALARDAQHQDLFVIGTDGRVWTTYWSLGDRGWHPWFPITDKPEDPNHAKFSTATPPAALARDAQHQDLFVIGTDGRVWTTYWSLGDRGWHPWFPITDDPSQHTIATFSKRTGPAALARDPQHQDLFVMGTDQRVWTSYWAG